MVSAPRGLNLRVGPHVSYAIQAVLPDGDAVEILDLPKVWRCRAGRWWKREPGIGWVNTHFLTEAEPLI